MELEATRFKAQEDLKQKDEQLTQLKHLLNTTINQKNHYQTLLNHHQTTTQPPYSTVSSIEDEPITNTTTFSSSDCEESIVSSPEQELVISVKALPEKGKFLEAVIKAGPLLQNLLLAGALPHWQHPPPPVDIYRIPAPLVVPQTPAPDRYLFNKKRGFVEGYDSSTETKYQRISID